MQIICSACGSSYVRLVKGDVIYPHRRGFHTKMFWSCKCGAYVGCHGATYKPLGTPADKKTRDARGKAHFSFDNLWMTNGNRAQAYADLADVMGIDPQDCHIGQFTYEQCMQVPDACFRIALRRARRSGNFHTPLHYDARELHDHEWYEMFDSRK